MQLNNCSSHCDRKAVLITSVDRGSCKHIARNVNQSDVYQFKIDGEVIKGDERRCDWLVINGNAKTAYYIELKGSDIEKAIAQLENTYSILKKEMPDYETYYRIVYKSGSHSVNSSKVIRWKEKMGCDVSGKKRAVVKQREMEEEI